MTHWRYVAIASGSKLKMLQCNISTIFFLIRQKTTKLAHLGTYRVSHFKPRHFRGLFWHEFDYQNFFPWARLLFRSLHFIKWDKKIFSKPLKCLGMKWDTLYYVLLSMLVHTPGMPSCQPGQNRS